MNTNFFMFRVLITALTVFSVLVCGFFVSYAGLFGHYFGAILDSSEAYIDGVHLHGVRPGSPAEKAGLQEGDIIVKFGGMVIRNYDDFKTAHKKQLPGPVEIIYIRQGKEYKTVAVLEARRKGSQTKNE